MQVLQKCGGMRIPFHEDFLVNTALELYSDAAGGAIRKMSQGWVVVNLQTGETFRLFLVKRKIQLQQKLFSYWQKLYPGMTLLL